MTAIILAAGVGKRMGRDAAPKCLLTLDGRSLLRRTLESLRAAGVEEVMLVVGFRQEEVKAEAQACSAGMRLEVVENPRYREGAILSLWSARRFLDRPALVMDADVLFPPSLLEKLVSSGHANAVLVDGSAADTGEEQMVFGRDGRVLQITKRPAEDLRRKMQRFGESLGFLKLSKEGALCLRGLLEAKVAAGADQLEHEQVYPELFQRVPVGYEAVDGVPWTEIDTPDDLIRAEREVYPRWRTPRCVNRVLSGWFLPGVLRLPLSPNQWTLISLGLGLGALAAMASGERGTRILGVLLFQLSTLADNWDGEVARARGASTLSGAWFDIGVDAVIQVLLPVCLAAGLRANGAPEWVTALGWVAAVGIALDFLGTVWGKLRGFGPAVCGDPSRKGVSIPGLEGLPWVRANLTNENFSLLIALVVLLEGRLPFLAAAAAGSHLFWAGLLLRWRRRLVLQ